jgi:hypothetical protein
MIYRDLMINLGFRAAGARPRRLFQRIIEQTLREIRYAFLEQQQ